MRLIQALRSKNIVVFFDFDNTIATCDVFDDMLLVFGYDKRWVKLEKEWLKGKIGSRDCLKKQIACMKFSAQELREYLRRVQIDPYFKPLVALLRRCRIKTYVISDNFDYILKRVLINNGIRGLRVFSNKARLSRAGKLIPEFPYTDNKCPLCAHCKKKNLLSWAGKNSIIVYIGDGRSDRCPAEYADVVFAKGYLLNFCREKKLPYLAFDSLKEVYGRLKGALR